MLPSDAVNLVLANGSASFCPKGHTLIKEPIGLIVHYLVSEYDLIIEIHYFASLFLCSSSICHLQIFKSSKY